MSTQGDDQSWVARALCASIEPDVLFVQGASQRQVRMREPLARELRSPHVPKVLSFVRPQLTGG